MTDETWQFSTPKERAVITAGAIAGLSVLGIGLSFIFNPVSLGVVAGVAALGQIQSQLFSVPAYRKWAIDRKVKKGKWSPVPEDAPFSRMTAEISSQSGRLHPPEIYTVDEDTVAKRVF